MVMLGVALMLFQRDGNLRFKLLVSWCKWCKPNYFQPKVWTKLQKVLKVLQV
ncbi:hypothetical protein Zm00014a_034055 [Zea mays]|uniref:Uncharacterized protein n=1 Tax=Zea mays TaxID=4577 RepID=A0A3L6DB47_MAIZE|nr:hypothetical protein Zm00014a_034055 [Zea mays]